MGLVKKKQKGATGNSTATSARVEKENPRKAKREQKKAVKANEKAARRNKRENKRQERKDGRKERRENRRATLKNLGKGLGNVAGQLIDKWNGGVIRTDGQGGAVDMSTGQPVPMSTPVMITPELAEKHEIHGGEDLQEDSLPLDSTKPGMLEYLLGWSF